MFVQLPRIPVRAAFFTVAAVACAAGVTALAPSPASAVTSGPTTLSYSTPGNGAFSVPAGVYRIYVTAAGGAGGDGGQGNATIPCPHGFGGAAGQVNGYFDVQPGQTVSYTVAGGGHLSGAGGYDTGLGGGTGGSYDGGGPASPSGNGGGGGGASSVTLDGVGILVAGGGGGGGGRGVIGVCGGDGGSGGQPATNGYNGTGTGTPLTYGAGGTVDATNTGLNGAPAVGWSSGGGGGGGGDGVQPGGGGGVDFHASLDGGGGGGAGGGSTAYTGLHNVSYSTTGSHGSAGFVNLSWGAPTTTTVPDVTGYGASVVLHAIVGDIDGGGTVDFTYLANGQVGNTAVPGCTGVPLVGLGDGVTFEASCTAATALLPADTVTATYSGDSVYGMSSGSGHVSVQQQASTTSLTPEATVVQPYATPRLTATVNADGYGTVAFLDETGQVACYASGPLSPAGAGVTTASCVTQLVSGSHTYTATYSGDPGFYGSTSAPVTISVSTTAPPINVTTSTPPTPPTIGTATPGDGSAKVTFSPPFIDGGSAVTGYTATATPVAGGTPVTATGTSSPITITGLTDGTAYTITVTATNAIGTSQASSPSSSVTPVAPVVPTPDLSVAIAPVGTLVHGRAASYRVTVTNTGTAKTTKPTVVAVALGRGLTAQGATASGWVCTNKGLTCTHRGSLAAGASLSYVVHVHVGTSVGTPVTTTARVTPADATPADNLATTTATARRS